MDGKDAYATLETNEPDEEAGGRRVYWTTSDKSVATEMCIRDRQALGLSFYWDREINTTDPEYYKWNQWIFLQLYNCLLYTSRCV